MNSQFPHVDTETLWQLYQTLGNLKAVTEQIGLTPSAISTRLRKAGHTLGFPGPRHIDLAGKRFGRLIALRHNGYRLVGKRQKPTWECLCDCGKTLSATAKDLQRGHKKSCGCLISDAAKIRGLSIRTHGLTGSPEYQAWKNMIRRCYNKNASSYHRYGGRGITVCTRWRESFQKFLSDMGYRPSTKHSLDRHPNNNGNYEPNNCRWATWTEQARNTSQNRLITAFGKTLTAIEWSEQMGIDYRRLWARIDKLKMHPEDALTRQKYGRPIVSVGP